MNKRLTEFDIIRIISALAVIMIHVTSIKVKHSNAAFLLNQASRFAVPIFIIISGFLIYYNDLTKSDISYKTFIGKRFKKVFIPYLAWTLVYTVYTAYLNSPPMDIDLKAFGTQLFKHVYLGTGYYHFYFLYAIMQIYLIYPIIKKLMISKDKQLLIGSFIITLISQTSTYLHEMGIIILPNIGVGYARLFPIWIFYFILGMYIAKHKDTFDSTLKGKAYVLVVLFIISLGGLVVDSKLTLTYGSSMKPTVLVYTIISFFMLYSSALNLRNHIEKFRRIIGNLAQHSFFVFLFHPLALNLLLKYYTKYELSLFLNTGAGMLLNYVIIVVISYSLSYIVSFLPMAAIFGSTARK